MKNCFCFFAWTNHPERTFLLFSRSDGKYPDLQRRNLLRYSDGNAVDRVQIPRRSSDWAGGAGPQGATGGLFGVKGGIERGQSYWFGTWVRIRSWVSLNSISKSIWSLGGKGDHLPEQWRQALPRPSQGLECQQSVVECSDKASSPEKFISGMNKDMSIDRQRNRNQNEF